MKLLFRPWEVIGVNIFMINYKTLLYIVDYNTTESSLL